MAEIPMSGSALDALSTWRNLLAELGVAGSALATAIEANDLLSGVATMMSLRRVRAALVRVDVPAEVRGDLAEIEAMSDVAALTLGARATESMMNAWLARPLPGDAALLGTPVGVAVLADAMLPPVWDFDSDLVVLVGAGLEPVAQVLADLGQRRIAILDGDASAAPAGAIAVTSNDELVTALRTLVPIPPSTFVVRAAAGRDPEALETTIDQVRDALSDLRIHRNTVRSFSKTWVEQGTANMPGLGRWPSVAALDGEFVGKPMVIVAPGPSLAKNVEQIRALKGRAIITAFSHSLKPVLAAGIEPDLVMTVDPQDVRYHFAGCDLGGACLVNAATVHPSLYELPAQRMLTMSANCAVDDWLFDALGEQALVPGGGSVATSAFALALRWKCDPIVFVGLDLSFPGGTYYVSTSSDGNARAHVDASGVMRVEGWSSGFNAMKASGGPTAATERAIELPGWGGGTVPSSFMFGLFHRWFVEQLGALQDGPRVYNCTEGGAFIEGMTHVPLAQVAAALDGHVDAARAIDLAILRADAPARTKRLADHVASYLAGLRRSRKLAVRAQALIARGTTAASEGRLARLEKALSESLRALGFASLLADRELERATDIARRDGTPESFLAASAALFSVLVRVIDQLLPALDQAHTRLRPRAPKRETRRAA